MGYPVNSITKYEVEFLENINKNKKDGAICFDGTPSSFFYGPSIKKAKYEKSSQKLFVNILFIFLIFVGFYNQWKLLSKNIKAYFYRYFYILSIS